MAQLDFRHSTGRSSSDSFTPFGSRTDKGRVREQNEDSLIVQPPLFVIADGMGGHAAGEVASEIAVHTIAELAPETADAAALGKAVEQANRDIINAGIAGRGREGMGTTCTAAVLDGNSLAIAQVGDSRAYLLHKGVLKQLTRDHSLMANMIEAGQLTPEEARVHPNRSVITRALGNDPNTTPDLYEINVEDGDRLLLCSDGLSSMLEDDEIQAVMNRYRDPQKCASTLVSGSLVAGGLDNVTVIIANVEGGLAKSHRKLALRTRITALLIVLMLALCLGVTIWGGSAYLHHTAYLAESEHGTVSVYRGVPCSVLGFSYSELVEETDIAVADLPPSAAESIRSLKGMRLNSVEEALQIVEGYKADIEAQKKASASSASVSSASTTSSTSVNSASASSDETSTGSEESEEETGSESNDEDEEQAV